MLLYSTSSSPNSRPQTPEQELRAAYHQLEETYQNHKLELPKRLTEGNIEAANLANESLSTALQQFRDAEARTNYTLEDGRVICCQDYHCLKQLAYANGLPLKDVEKLNLYGNQISDIKPLGNLIALQHLCLNNNQITDIGALRSLIDLKSLDLADNKVTNIETLESLSALQDLNLDGNKIADVRPLTSLTMLKTLSLKNTPHTAATLQTVKELKQRGVYVFD